MANPLDTDAGSELFSSYEAELKLVQADLTQKLDSIPDLSGEPRKAAISQAERALEEAQELVRSYILHLVLGLSTNILRSLAKCNLNSPISPPTSKSKPKPATATTKPTSTPQNAVSKPCNPIALPFSAHDTLMSHPVLAMCSLNSASNY